MSSEMLEYPFFKRIVLEEVKRVEDRQIEEQQQLLDTRLETVLKDLEG
jgi:hypothetical protein